MRALLLIAFVLTTTTKNNDSCDISLLPAATLLLPYFEVDLETPPANAQTTLFTIQNTSAQPQIARVTLRTDWAYPVLTFNVFLTGYGVASINLRDILGNGVIAQNGTDRGALSNAANPHFLRDAGTACASMPSTIPDATLTFMRLALTGQKVALAGCGDVQIGSVHRDAIGYATIDVVATCDTLSAENDEFFTRDLLFDNVLTGDYQYLNPNPAIGNYAGGNPLVHIRAIPEGGAAGEARATNLPFTFYDLYTTGAPSRTHDRRQPLPAAFMPSFLNGGPGAFNTNYVMWREPYEKPPQCPQAQYPYPKNGNLGWYTQIRFDEHENPMFPGCSICIPEQPPGVPGTPVTLSINLYTSSLFPQNSYSSDLGGWMYVDLSNEGSPNYSSSADLKSSSSTRYGPRQSQGWLTTTMFAEGRYSVTMDSAAIGNGCSPDPVTPSGYTSTPYFNGGTLGPAPNPNPSGARAGSPATTNNDDSCDISVLPAATLLLPYFDVDFKAPQVIARQTLFSVQNTSALPQIARVTVWTDWSYPVLTFNIFLTGYDVQSINLYDIIFRGRVAPGPYPATDGGTSNKTPPGVLSKPNDANPNFLADASTTCAAMPDQIPPPQLTALQLALSTGELTGATCQSKTLVGSAHDHAIGYVTIDVVANCDTLNPLSPDYVTRELLFDNVLTGDWIDVNPNQATGNYAGGNPLVHIRAIPEGGAAGSHPGTQLPYTFYDRYTTRAPSRTFDRRQPLPSAFAPRFIQGSGDFFTNLKIWREGPAAIDACATNAKLFSAMSVGEIIRFDEHENPAFVVLPVIPCGACEPALPIASSVATSAAPFPQSSSSDLGGWMYLNLHDGRSTRPSQNWVVTSMHAEGRYSVDMDSVPLGNGCSPIPTP